MSLGVTYSPCGAASVPLPSSRPVDDRRHSHGDDRHPHCLSIHGGAVAAHPGAGDQPRIRQLDGTAQPPGTAGRQRIHGDDGCPGAPLPLPPGSAHRSPSPSGPAPPYTGRRAPPFPGRAPVRCGPDAGSPAGDPPPWGRWHHRSCPGYRCPPSAPAHGAEAPPAGRQDTPPAAKRAGSPAPW